MKQPDGELVPITLEEFDNPSLVKKRGLEVGPVFTVGEEIEIKGTRFKIMAMGRREMRLRSLPTEKTTL